MAITQATHDAINKLDRTRIIEILEAYGFACCDKESTEELREALREHCESTDDIPSSLLES